MKHTRIIVTHYGGPDALRVLEEERPEPKAGEVRVRVLAAGVSLPDLMAREGIHPETPRLPFTPGWDLVGVVDRLGDGVSGIEAGQMVFDSMGGSHIWRSRKALRPGGRVVAYGLTGSLRGGRLASGRSYIAAGRLLPRRKRVIPYSIQWLKRLRPALFRRDLTALFGLLHQKKLKPVIARRLPLAEARLAHELLGKGGVIGKLVLVTTGAT
jgi:NADPH:quinone reductase-like Zn-dependent oxidoreductase